MPGYSRKKPLPLHSPEKELAPSSAAPYKRLLHNPSVHIALIILSGLLSYSNTFHSPFVFDDLSNIVENHRLKSFSNMPSFFTRTEGPPIMARPLTAVTFAINYHLVGLDTAGYHIFNLVLHIANGLLLYLLIKITAGIVNHDDKDKIRLVALFSSLIFTVHPIQTESVTYIVSRSVLLSTFFFLLGIMLFAKTVGTDGRKKTAWAAALFITSLLGMASREEFVLFPVMLSLYDLYFISRRNIKGLLKTYRIHLPVISTLGYVLFIVLSYDYGEHAGYGVKTITPLQYLITQFNVHWTYLRLLVLPINQNLDYDYPIAKTLIELPTMISFIGYIGIWVTGILLYRKKPIVSFCILWFMITLAPSSSIMPLADVIFEHRLYLPVIGLISGCVVSFFYLLDKIKKQRYTDGVTISSLVIFAVFIIFLSTVTYSRNMVWTNAIGLWADTALKSPAKARPYVTLAEEYRKAGDNDKALAYFQQAISIDPNFYEAYTGVGQILTHFHRYSEAIHSLEKAIQLNPRYAQAFNSLGIIYALTADYQGAIEQFHQALRIDPSDIRAAINLGNAYMERGNLSTSNYYYAYAMRLDSNNPDIYFNLGVLQERLGNYENAASYYRQALALNPGHTEAIRTLNIIRNQIAK